MKSKLIFSLLSLALVITVTGCGKKSEMEADAKKIAQFECDSLKVIQHPEDLEALSKLAAQEEFILDLQKKYKSEKVSEEDRTYFTAALHKETANCASK